MAKVSRRFFIASSGSLGAAVAHPATARAKEQQAAAVEPLDRPPSNAKYKLTLDVNGFWRESERLIVLLGTDRTYTYQNLYSARARGLENALSWTAPGRYVTLDGSFTWLDLRNVSREGTFERFEGDRIPNRPYLFGSWGGRLRFDGVIDERDNVEPFYHGRYVHEFFRGWESVGTSSGHKHTVDAQVTHSLGVSWTVTRDLLRATSTAEVDNVTDAKVFDNFGVQRPGRAFYLKASAEWR